MERGDVTELISQSRTISTSPFDNQVKTQGGEALAAPLRIRFEKARKEIQPKLLDRAITSHAATLTPASPGQGFVGTLDHEKVCAYLGDVDGSIKKKMLPVANRIKEAALQHTETGIEILDGTAYLLRSLSLAMNNHAGLPQAALRITLFAQSYAASEDCQNRLKEDESTLRFLSLRDEAMELAKVRRYRESLAKLEEALPFAETEQTHRQS